MDRLFSAYSGDEPYIFISYAHRDSTNVYPEFNWLREQGLNIWYDEGIDAGADWREELAVAISKARVFLFFVEA
ncbi:MAG: hypothetical protein ACI9VI_002474 [Candidatus Azotimanducaceae bacterium]|jgi:hypothetical protein